jgi:hypothetical protein
MQLNKTKKWWLTPLLLILAIVVLHLVSLHGYWIEKIYSTHIYPPVASLLRILTGWLPFSLGDILYGLAFIWVLYKTVQFFCHKPTWRKFLFALRNLAVKFLWVYVFFLLMWGLNYYRYGIGYQLNIIPEEYNTEDLKNTTAQLLLNLNASAKKLDSLHYTYPANKVIFKQAIDMYDNAEKEYAFFNYKHAAVKQMFVGTIGNYSGFLGYYNPFTGEAQVNTVVPPFVIPFTTCHEMAHQLGYASESEASFVGYLVTKYNNVPVFNYSAYFDLFTYANAELYHRDSAAAKQNVKLLDTLVKKDYAAYRKYLNAYKNPIEPLLTKLYGSYLKAHNQPQGIESYDEVVAWIVAYYKKYGTL